MPPEEKHRRNTEMIVKEIHSSEKRVAKCQIELVFFFTSSQCFCLSHQVHQVCALLKHQSLAEVSRARQFGPQICVKLD